MSEFGFGEVRDYQPSHGDIDWLAVFNANHPDNEEQPNWFEHTDELGFLQTQVHQENTVIWLNRTDPKFDCIVVSDPRDNNAFWFSRDRIGEPLFSSIVEALSDEVLVARTKFPSRPCVDYVLMCAMREIDNLTESEDGKDT